MGADPPARGRHRENTPAGGLGIPGPGPGEATRPGTGSPVSGMPVGGSPASGVGAAGGAGSAAGARPAGERGAARQQSERGEMSPAVSVLSSVPRRANPLSLRDRPVRTKLVAALLVPTVAFLVMACLSAAASVSRANGYQDGVSLATLGRDVTATVHELQLERDIAAGFVGNERRALGPDEKNKPGQRLATQEHTVDVAVAGFRGALARTRGDLPASTRAVANAAESALTELPALRAAVNPGQGLPGGAITDQYSGTIAALLNLDVQIGRASGDEHLRQEVTALNDLSNLKELSSQARGMLYSVAFNGRFQFRQGQDLASLLARETAAESRFRADADLNERSFYDQTVTGQAVLAATRIESTAIDLAGRSSINVDPQQWYNASTTRIELLRTVEEHLLGQVINQASHLRDDAWRQVAITGAGIVLILVLAFSLSFVIASSMADPLRRLRNNALEVAHTRLPRLIEELRTAEGETPRIRIEPVGIDSRDEIGEVARTVDELQYEAVRLAAEQATLRRGVNTMFLNLSRRSQALIERQLSLIDQLEAAEQDPTQLENLFKLDHLATRMRRNSENLLVLAGAGMGRRRAKPVSLADVLRAAIGEIEQFERVDILSVPNVEIASQAVNHVVHLVAELLENAAQFSPPHSAVSLSAYALADGGALIKIEDAGMGMSDSEIAAANRRLAEAPIFDFSIAQRMGLFVVARLASRHKVRVRLQRSAAGGVTGMIELPAMLLASPKVPAQNRLGSGGPTAALGPGVSGVAGRTGPGHGPGTFLGSAPAIGGLGDQVAGHDGAFALDPDNTVTPPMNGHGPGGRGAGTGAPAPSASAGPSGPAASAGPSGPTGLSGPPPGGSIEPSTGPVVLPRDVNALPRSRGTGPSTTPPARGGSPAASSDTGGTWFSAADQARTRGEAGGGSLDRRNPGAAAAAAAGGPIPPGAGAPGDAASGGIGSGAGAPGIGTPGATGPASVAAGSETDLYRTASFETGSFEAGPHDPGSFEAGPYDPGAYEASPYDADARGGGQYGDGASRGQSREPAGYGDADGPPPRDDRGGYGDYPAAAGAPGWSDQEDWSDQEAARTAFGGRGGEAARPAGADQTIFTSLTDLYGLRGRPAEGAAEGVGGAGSWPDQLGVDVRSADRTSDRAADRSARGTDAEPTEQIPLRRGGTRPADLAPPGPGRATGPDLPPDPGSTGPLTLPGRAGSGQTGDSGRPERVSWAGERARNADERRLSELRQMREARRLHEIRGNGEALQGDDAVPPSGGGRRPEPTGRPNSRADERREAAQTASPWDTQRAPGPTGPDPRPAGGPRPGFVPGVERHAPGERVGAAGDQRGARRPSDQRAAGYDPSRSASAPGAPGVGPSAAGPSAAGPSPAGPPPAGASPTGPGRAGAELWQPREQRPTASAEWRGAAPARRDEDTAQPPAPAVGADGQPVWSTHSDPGWRAASAAQTPVPGGITSTGLPIRVPRAQLVPGQTEDPWAGAPAANSNTATPQPEQVRGRLSSLYEGVQRAREVADPYRDDFDGRRS